MSVTSTQTRQKLDASLDLLNQALIALDVELEKSGRENVEFIIKQNGFTITTDEVFAEAKKMLPAFRKIQDSAVWIAGKASGFHPVPQ